MPPPELKDSRERFSATARDYHLYRPGYPAALADWIAATAGVSPPARVVDLGCGTGISSRMFAARGFTVTGVDPNDEMLAYARDARGATYVQGEAAATGLPDASADMAIGGQCFHWFDLPSTFRELRRILVPGAWSFAFWNVRARSPFLDEYEELLRATSSDYGAISKFDATLARVRDFPEAFDTREAELPHAQALDREAFRGRVASSSYVVHGVADRDAFAHRLDDLFDRHQKEGRVEFNYRTIVIAWRVAPPS